MRILVVEDEIDLQEAIVEGLRLDGYAVDSCNDGEKAYEADRMRRRAFRSNEI